MEPFKAIEEHIDKDETEEKEAEEKIDIKMEEIKEQNENNEINKEEIIITENSEPKKEIIKEINNVNENIQNEEEIKKIQENEEKNEIREEIKIIQESEPQEEIIKDDNKNKENIVKQEEIKEIKSTKEIETEEKIIINENDNINNNNGNEKEQKEEDIINNNTISENKITIKENDQENLHLKPQKPKSEFELHIIQAYKYLIGQNSSPNKSGTNNNIPEKQIPINSDNTLNVKNCEKEIRLALNSCIETKIISINKNILDKMARIIRHNKINLIFVIGQIYINLMTKDYLFNPLNKSINLELLIIFCNEVISLKSILKQTYLGNKYNQTLIHFILKIMKEYTFEKEQLAVMIEILETHNTNQKPIKVKSNNFEDMVKSINEILNEQESFYDQYKFIFDNNDIIENMINKCDINKQEDLKYLNNYLDLGKIFSYLLFNKNFVIYLKQQSQESEMQGINKKLFNGYEDNINVNAIEDEKFYIDIDEDIEYMRENLCRLIIKYVEKFKGIKTLFEFQYVLYVLIKRIYFHFYEKFKDKIDILLSEIITNLCIFKTESIEEIKIFINEILKSEKENDSNLKKLITEKIEQNKSNPDFNYKFLENENKNNSNDQIENYFTNITNISIETIFISQNDLRVGFFNKKIIKAGEIFTFYVELSHPYGILDFCMVLEDYDIKLRIKNLTEGREVYNENEVTIFHCPLKLTMFFTKPGIFQFEIDNSYSWLRSKTVRYKVNKFYPQKAYYLERKIILMKYKEIIYNRKKMSTINYNKGADSGEQDLKEKIFIVKFNGENNSFNCSDTTLNIEISNKMGRDNYLKISSIYINIEKEKEKSYFLVDDSENKTLIKYELNKDNFMNYLKKNIIEKSTVNIDIINLYIITENVNILDNHYMSIEDILGFEPEIQTDENINIHCKILFFLQYLHQAQILYYLFTKINNNEKVYTTFLINYNTYSGCQICLYRNGEICLKIENDEIKKEESLEQNLILIANEIKKFNKDEKIEILIGENINGEDKEINAEKVGDKLIKKLGMNLEEEGNLKVIYLNRDFNRQVNLNSHIFYLNE